MKKETSSTLPLDSKERKMFPIYEGLLKYFPAALAGVANHSQKGNDKHNKGLPLHHSRGKSKDHGDCILRHLIDFSELEAKLKRKEITSVDEILGEVNALAWRALAFSQEVHELYGNKPLAPNAEHTK